MTHSVSFVQMNTARAHGVGLWFLTAASVLLSIASAFSCLMYMGQGIAVGALVGLPGREADIAFAQHWGRELASRRCYLFSRVDCCWHVRLAVLRKCIPGVAVRGTPRSGLDPLNISHLDYRDCGSLNHHRCASSIEPEIG